MSWGAVTAHTVPQLFAIIRAMRRRDAAALSDAALAAAAPHGKAAADQVRKTITARSEPTSLKP